MGKQSLEKAEELEKVKQVVKQDEEKVETSKTDDITGESELPVDPNVELEQYKQSLMDWSVWAETKTAEYNHLLESYNQYVEAYAILQTEFGSLQLQKEEKEVAWSELAEELREKKEEIACLKPALEALEQEKQEKEVAWSELAEELREKKEEIACLK